MFTGIVEELGHVVSREGARLRTGAERILDDAELGASIAVNGCCLTVVDWDAGAGWWEAEVTEETYRRTSLGLLAPGHPVNLERPVRLSDRLGGHLVQGHVDDVGVVVEAAHFCMMMRGVEKQNSKTVTSALRGAFRDDRSTREEFLRLVHSR